MPHSRSSFLPDGRRFRRWFRRSSESRLRQGAFGFIRRGERLARRFKLTIVALTALVVVGLLMGTTTGRHVAHWSRTRARWVALRVLGKTIDRSETDADWRHKRLYDIEQTRGKLQGVYDEYDPKMKALLDYTGLDPQHALLRWGNFDRTLLLPSTIFEADDTGRSYRFRPNVRSIWVRNLRLKGGILAYFPIPDGPRFDAPSSLPTEAGPSSGVPAAITAAPSPATRTTSTPPASTPAASTSGSATAA